MAKAKGQYAVWLEARAWVGNIFEIHGAYLYVHFATSLWLQCYLTGILNQNNSFIQNVTCCITGFLTFN